jgi:glucoamylase
MMDDRPNHPNTVASLVHPISLSLVPPPQQLGPVTQPWLFSTLLGNGSLLACFDASGSPAQLFYPHVDAGPHVRSFLLGIQLIPMSSDGFADAAVSWLSESNWVHELHHVESAPALHVVSTNESLALRLERTIAVDPNLDVLTMEISAINLRSEPVMCRMVAYAGLEIDYRRSGTTCYFDLESRALVYFAADKYIALMSNAPVIGHACAKTTIGTTDELFIEVSAGSFNNQTYAVGLVSGAICIELGCMKPEERADIQLVFCCSRKLDDVTRLVGEVRLHGPTVAESVAWWRERYVGAKFGSGSPAVRDLYERSLIVLQLLTDRSTGAIIAAPEVDPDFRGCDGYGYCWPRDGVINAHALDVVGQTEHARQYYNWLLRVQEDSGVWYQRYHTTGEVAPTWGLVQFDETGTVVWAICRHIHSNRDLEYARAVYPALVRACKYMQNTLDIGTGLAPITKDLWEERDAISTYACASTWAAFHELSQLSSALGQEAEAALWESEAAKLRSAIEVYLWDTAHMRFVRGQNPLLVRRDTLSETALSPLATSKATQNDSPAWRDPVLDISILGLSEPFGVFAPQDHRMRATADAIADALISPAGGIMRYEGDTYRGGNPWVVCTLWLAWQDLKSGNHERALALFNWVVNHRTVLNLLPEQLDRTTGKPCWVTPLGWSHSMFLLVATEFERLGLLP